jgi:hypothetical protein
VPISAKAEIGSVAILEFKVQIRFSAAVRGMDFFARVARSKAASAATRPG